MKSDKDKNLLPHSRKILKVITEISIERQNVQSRRKHTTAKMTSYEKSLDDLKNNRMHEYDSLDDLIKEIG